MRVKRPVRAVANLFFFKTPLEAQLIITRRCNLSCGYCTEYDNYSQPVPFDVLKERIDAIHRLNALNITLLGGEPLMHPDLVEIVKYCARKNQVSITTNGFLLTQSIIEQLNKSGLSNLQISIDTLETDSTRYIQKSLKKLLSKLELLKKYANFDVHANVVLCESTKETFKETVDRIRDFGFHVSIDLFHDGNGKLQVRGEDYLQLWNEHFESGAPFTTLDLEYGQKLLQGQSPKWKCRAGSRILYIDEFGLVQYCSSQRDRLNKPITEYTLSDLREQSKNYKGCEEGCSLLCAYRNSMLDNESGKVAKEVYKAFSQGIVSVE
ncbi:radical SAM protein [Oscillatoriales cyanobacterium LEGE 11467]|uniref:Radical SAM protein n=1 Tax=Zarconia navalis LEGE 11467 TaxID=1828826 RepID=A0A928VVL0_9CYAN|nr:radical SAM protein [Zarconia navalis]MBE9041149.1 radical SAM protein [Zarconia navalis LEGE 11467]